MSKRSGAFYLVTAALACVTAFFIMHLWHFHPGIPLYYMHGGDELVMLAWTKALVDDGWYLTISHLGAPDVMSFGDFPIPNMLHMLVLRVLTLVIHNPVVALNVYFLAGFPIIAAVSAYVMRRLGFAWTTAAFTGIIYAFLPTRFMRNESHLFYAQYYLAPVLVLAIIWAVRGQVLFDSERRRPTRDGWIYLVGLFAVSWDNEYFAIFGMLFLALASLAAALRAHHVRGAFAGIAGIVILLIGAEVELLPFTIYQHQNGADAAAIVRPPQASEVYALTFAQLILPIQDHRIHRLATRRAYFDAGLPMLVNENSSASLGALGAIGFVGSLAALILLRRERENDLWPDLAKLNVTAFVLATIGGAGAIISYYFVPELRAYNRISPIIGFISLASLALALEYIRSRWLSRPALDRGWYAALVVVAILAILDQTSVNYIPAYDGDREAFLSEAAYAARLEHALPANAAVYQVPHVLFPEGPPVEQLGSWDQVGLYLHTHQLRYSFGATRGRSLDTWEQQTDGRPAPSFVMQVLLAGFDAIAVYRSGYPDGGKSVTEAIGSATGVTPIVRDDGSISVFNLSGIRAAYRASFGAPRADAVARSVIAPSVSMTYGDGFYGQESAAGRTWNWAPSQASLNVQNASDYAQRVRVRLRVAAGAPAAAHLEFRVPTGGASDYRISSTPAWVSEELTVPPGTSHVALRTDARRLAAAGDQRDLRFQVLDATIETADVAAASDAIGRIIDREAMHALPQIGATFGGGCYQQESSPSRTWHWCSGRADLILQNTSRQAQKAFLQFVLVTGAPADVSETVGRRRTVLRGTPEGSSIKQLVTVPPGETVLHFVTQAAPIVAPGDARRMVFQVADLRVSGPSLSAAAR